MGFRRYVSTSLSAPIGGYFTCFIGNGVAQLNGKNYLYIRPPGSQGTDWIYGDVQPDRLQDFKITNMTYNEIAIG